MTPEPDSQDSGIRVQSTRESPVLHALEVEVDAARVERAFARAYKELAKRVQVRGFRPGKAPRSVLERLYGASVAEQIEHALVAETLPGALQQAGLEPVTEPAIDASPPRADAAFRYTARVEVKPELSLCDTRGLPATRPRVQVSDQDVEREFEALRVRSAPVIEEPEGTTVAAGHVLAIDFVGRVDGKPFQGGSGRGVEFEMGSGRFLPEFERQLLGAAVGEDREIQVQFPEDYGSRELAGKQGLFSVHVVAIKRRQLPELDDEFAKDQGDFESLDELRERIRTDLTTARMSWANAEVRRTLMDSLIERTPFELPPGLVARQLDRQLSAARRRLEGSLPEQALEAQMERWKEEWRGRAEREVREMLLLEAVAKAEGITAEDEEVEARIEGMAHAQGITPAALRQALGEGDLRGALRAQIVDEKALDLLSREAKVEETTDS
jgi:trigger factor